MEMKSISPILPVLPKFRNVACTLNSTGETPDPMDLYFCVGGWLSMLNVGFGVGVVFCVVDWGTLVYQKACLTQLKPVRKPWDATHTVTLPTMAIQQSSVSFSSTFLTGVAWHLDSSLRRYPPHVVPFC